jgi:2'-5' RNA ligase
MRCFAAVWPSREVTVALTHLPRPTMDGLRWSGEEQWHITLRFFGELDPRELQAATNALALVAQGLTPTISAKGGPATRFLGPGLVIWPVEGLGPLARATERATARLGKPLPERKFFGHLTLARGGRGTDLRRFGHLLAPLAMTWPVTSLTLVQSELHPQGARYRILEELPLNL